MPSPAHRLSSYPAQRSGERGAVLITALLFMAVIALALTSYLNLNISSARLARQAHHQAGAFNLAEAGAEEALSSLNRSTAGQADAWDGWTIADPTARRAFENFDLGGNTIGRVQVYLDNHTPSGSARPTIVALATVSSPNSIPVEKMLELILSRRSRFVAGLMAKETVTFSGTNTTVDSWNSDPDANAATAPIDYSAATRNDAGSIASVQINSTSVLVNQADIWGRVYTAGPAPEVGPQGSITGRDTPAGVQVDPSRVTTDFSATFTSATAPVDGTPILTVGSTLGTAGMATKWRCSGISLRGNDTLTILGDVTLVITAGSGTQAISVTGNASIIIAAQSSLTLYVEGDMQIAGKGLANNNTRPSTCLIYGVNTSPAGQVLQLAGNGALRAAVYAPNANVTLNGNGDMMGAVIGRRINLTGNADFHFDESLQNLDDNMPFTVTRWRELTTAAERGAKQAQFDSW